MSTGIFFAPRISPAASSRSAQPRSPAMPIGPDRGARERLAAHRLHRIAPDLEDATDDRHGFGDIAGRSRREAEPSASADHWMQIPPGGVQTPNSGSQQISPMSQTAMPHGWCSKIDGTQQSRIAPSTATIRQATELVSADVAGDRGTVVDRRLADDHLHRHDQIGDVDPRVQVAITDARSTRRWPLAGATLPSSSRATSARVGALPEHGRSYRRRTGRHGNRFLYRTTEVTERDDGASLERPVAVAIERHHLADRPARRRPVAALRPAERNHRARG